MRFKGFFRVSWGSRIFQDGFWGRFRSVPKRFQGSFRVFWEFQGVSVCLRGILEAFQERQERLQERLQWISGCVR